MRPLALLLAILVALACTPPPPGPTAAPPPATASESPSPASAVPPSATDASPRPTPTECAAPTGTVDAAVVEDLRTIVGGSFSVDHLGPEAFDAIEARLRAAPDAYLDAWAQQAFASTIRADAHWDALLSRTEALRPDRTRTLAGCLSSRLDRELAAPPASTDPDWALRVAERQRTLYLRWSDLEPDDTWRLAVATRACHEGTTLTVEADCTCGEPVVCRVESSTDPSDVLVTLDLTKAGMCRDCFAATGTCTLPTPIDDETSAPTLNGRALPVTPCPLP